MPAHDRPIVARPRAFFALGLATLLALTLLSGAAQAQIDPYERVGSLIAQGQLELAAETIEQHLLQAPRDPQMRFLKGVVATRRAQTDEAMATFEALTRDYPELPEPYNNLASLYAAQGQLGKARVALETALRNHPDYATAQENLGDVYAALALQAYRRAAGLGATSASLRPKIENLQKAVGDTPAR